MSITKLGADLIAPGKDLSQLGIDRAIHTSNDGSVNTRLPSKEYLLSTYGPALRTGTVLGTSLGLGAAAGSMLTQRNLKVPINSRFAGKLGLGVGLGALALSGGLTKHLAERRYLAQRGIDTSVLGGRHGEANFSPGAASMYLRG